MAEAFDDEPEVGEAPPAAGALRRRGIYLLPNLFTTGVLFCGFFAIVQAMNGRFEVGAIAIFVAMVLDGMDGRVARWRHVASPMGRELDSLADVISFGVAPAGIAFAAGLPLGYLISRRVQRIREYEPLISATAAIPIVLF